MPKIKYVFSDRTISEAEVSEDLYIQYLYIKKKADLIYRSETRRHQSLEKSLEHGFDFADKKIEIEEETERLELRKRLHNSLKRLTEKQRLVLICFAIHGLSFREIARKMKLNKDTVREHYQAAIKKMKKFLKNTPPKSVFRGY